VDIEAQLRQLESRYRAALSGAVAAKAHYLALCSEPLNAPAELARAKERWDMLESRKHAIAARMGEIEELDLNTASGL
jgi:hypothetical protein